VRLPVHSPAAQRKQQQRGEPSMVRLFDRIRSGQYTLAPYDVTFVQPAEWEAYSQAIRPSQ